MKYGCILFAFLVLACSDDGKGGGGIDTSTQETISSEVVELPLGDPIETEWQRLYGYNVTAR